LYGARANRGRIEAVVRVLAGGRIDRASAPSRGRGSPCSCINRSADTVDPARCGLLTSARISENPLRTRAMRCGARARPREPHVPPPPPTRTTRRIPRGTSNRPTFPCRSNTADRCHYVDRMIGDCPRKVQAHAVHSRAGSWRWHEVETLALEVRAGPKLARDAVGLLGHAAFSVNSRDLSVRSRDRGGWIRAPMSAPTPSLALSRTYEGCVDRESRLDRVRAATSAGS